MATPILSEPSIDVQEQPRVYRAPISVGELPREAADIPAGEPIAAGRIRTGRLPALTEEGAASSEMFRILANRLAGVRRAVPLKSLHVTSCMVGEGKSVIAANLAVTLARRPEERVLLIEGDLRRPSLAGLFAAREAAGIGEWWESPTPLPCIHAVEGTALSILFAGKVVRPQEAMASARLPAMLERLAPCFDWIVIDSPPLLPVMDAARWAAWADGTLLVLRAGCSSRSDVVQALASLDRARIVATVLNEAPNGGSDRYYRQYYAESAQQIPA